MAEDVFACWDLHGLHATNAGKTGEYSCCFTPPGIASVERQMSPRERPTTKDLL